MAAGLSAAQAEAAKQPTLALANFVSELAYDGLPEQVASRVKDIVLDTVASALAGHDASETAKVLQLAREIATSSESSTIGGGRLSMAGATLVNGYLITAVTVCDIHRPSSCHVTPEVVAPALVTAEAEGSSGRDFIAAVAAGLEVTTRIGLALDPAAFRARGWHAPGVTGPFGGAAAVGKLLGLDSQRQCIAFGIAGSQAAGTYAQLGSNTIKFQQSRGALGGLLSARLASHDFSAAGEILTHPDGGLFSAYAEGGRPGTLLDRLGEDWELTRISLRAWPVAVHLQPVVTGLLALIEKHDLRPNAVKSVHLSVSPTAYKMHGTMNWDDRFRARLSTPYVTAVVLHDRRCWLEQFTSDRVQDRALDRFIAEKVTVEPSADQIDGTALIEIVDMAGKVFREHVIAAKGEPENPLSHDEILAKLHSARKGLLSEQAAEKAIDLITNLERLSDMRELSDCLRATERPAAVHYGRGRMEHRFAPFLELAARTQKPRSRGITMLGDRGWPASFIEGTLVAYGHAIDIAKISIRHIQQPEDVVREKLNLYKKYDIETQIGGPVIEIARLQGKGRLAIEYLAELGFDSVELASEAIPTQGDLDEEAEFTRLCRELGMKVHGEVGKKFPKGDKTRKSARVIDVDETVRQFKNYLDNGAVNVYWEGHVLRMVLGDNGERSEGRPVVKAVADAVGIDNIIFEVPYTYLPYASKRALQALLVYMFGPNVNIGNVLIEEIAEMEEIRAGIFPAFGAPSGDHPWIASLAKHGGVAADDWWRGN